MGQALRGRFSKWLLLTLLATLFIPVRLSALAPAEVVALNSMVVAAPMDGVIGAIYVQPNSQVKKGEVLFALDNTSLVSRREVAVKALSIARAEALVAEQRAFDDLKSKAELAVATGRVREKEAELAAVAALLARVAIKAERDGIAVYSDPNDWLGRPVQTGERIMQLADPHDAGVLVWLPVADALNLEPVRRSAFSAYPAVIPSAVPHYSRPVTRRRLVPRAFPLTACTVVLSRPGNTPHWAWTGRRGFRETGLSSGITCCGGPLRPCAAGPVCDHTPSATAP